MTTLYTGITCPDPSFVHTPLIEIRAVSDDAPLQEAAAKVATYDYLLFTSRFAVSPFAQWLMLSFRNGTMSDTRIVSIGPATTKALQQAGFKTVEQVEHDDSYGVIDWFSRQCHKGNDHAQGNVLIPRSNLALPIIPDGLRRLGFEVETIVAYENHMPKQPQKVDLRQIDRIVFTSPSTLDNFLHLYGSLPRDKELVTRGAVTKQHLQNILSQNIYKQL